MDKIKIERPEDWQELIYDLNRSYPWELPGQPSADGLETLLAEKLNALILSDFNALIGILYRIDIDEVRLKELLKTGVGEDAGKIMARLIIERQWQKIQTRKNYEAGTSDWQEI
jgi:hypothetical protein